MTEVKTFDLKKLHQEEDYGFHKLMLIETSKSTDPKITEKNLLYKSAFTKFDEVLKPGGKNPMTANLTSLDAERDKTYSSTVATTRAMIDHFDPDKVEIAKAVMSIIEKYGNPTALGYQEENGVLENLIQELKAYDNPLPDDDRPVIESSAITYERLSAIGIKDWVNHLEQLNNQFIALFSDRNAAQAAIETGASKAAREAADKAYRELVRRINSLIDVNGEEAYADLVSKMNTLIDYQLSTLAARSTRNAKKKKLGDDDRPAIE